MKKKKKLDKFAKRRIRLLLIVIILIISIFLIFNRKDKKEEQYSKMLPGYNCGACGFGSCDGMAKAMMENIDSYKKCKPLRGDALKEMEAYVENLKK